MAVNLNCVSAWTLANQALVENMQSALTLLQDAPYSADPASPYQQAQAAAQALAAQAKRLAVLGLRQIDEAIAEGTLIQQLDAAAAEAKREADVIAAATKTVTGITKAVDSVTGLVTKIGALPFL
ncbi:MAG TPA: hypothetical protein VGB65_06225 [Allosphingosinicella sp.]|jgi:hypothetical protein